MTPLVIMRTRSLIKKRTRLRRVNIKDLNLNCLEISTMQLGLMGPLPCSQCLYLRPSLGEDTLPQPNGSELPRQSFLGDSSYPGRPTSWIGVELSRPKTKKNPRAPEAAWTFDKLTGQGKFLSESRQLKLPTGLLAQVKEAAFGAWRAVPTKGSLTTPLTKIIQGPQEPYSDFVGRLLETAERVLGPEEANGKFLKQVAYENANSACKAILRGHRKNKTLDDFVRLCADVDTFSHRISQSIHLAVRAALQAANPPPKGCFRCGQLRHFARQCRKVQGSRHPSIGPTNAPMRALNKPMPATICPKCKRGKHWANQCRSKTDAFGNPLTPSWKPVEGSV
ncbi:endogenous retrovirus group K member 8 Gag polyprotein-like [Psammomys obesus]|uniref:endogenous retrovirus group K member 8 Gag polyprotein-like n=1 Tax=Psammomys obesus TaxID=48139 RepID=UPI002452F43F|nr:endogenous retrovirus group K member 8 Gag polyprotein-like [Psammomys obesus]XP_055468854.1 endogenous retrovirus group K member 8 Gag polyprotein-like [Psammomys obesus]